MAVPFCGVDLGAAPSTLRGARIRAAEAPVGCRGSAWPCLDGVPDAQGSHSAVRRVTVTAAENRDESLSAIAALR
jgi:hypothetical protein